MTLSISGRCDRTGMLGMAIASSSIAVAARCVFARAGIGVAATQNLTDPRLGPKCLELLKNGLDPQTTLATVLSQAEHASFRQLTILDADGQSASFSGDRALGNHASAAAQDCVAAGNLLANTSVPKAMVDAFSKVEGSLGLRLLSSVEAGLVAGGEAGSVHSAGMLIVHVQPWPLVDLRIDWSNEGPIAALRALWHRYEPQTNDFVTRALDPAQAPSYNVPGDKATQSQK